MTAELQQGKKGKHRGEKQGIDGKILIERKMKMREEVKE